MNTLCIRCQVRPWQQDRTRITVLVLIVIILTITAIEGWMLAEVTAVITAVTAVSATASERRAAP